MLWIRHLPARLGLLALLAIASLTGIGELALHDVHAGHEGGSAAHQHFSASHGVSAPEPIPTPDGHPLHTCHCAHVHGVALVASTGELSVQAPGRAVAVDLASAPARSTTAPPFHPPKTLS
jgi:hypothetical protein